MKIFERAINASAIKTDNPIEEQKRSDRFSQLLKSNDRKDQKNAKDVRKNKQVPQVETMTPNSINPDPSLISASRDVVAPAQGDASKPEAANSQIERLVNELGHQIDLFRVDGKTNAINITFSSKTLEGLHVQIRQQEGELAIRFVTQSDTVAKLISRHTDELRESLVGKGVKIRNIAIARTPDRAPQQGNRNAGS
jgi:flagellar hook-length control protein FliK